MASQPSIWACIAASLIASCHSQAGSTGRYPEMYNLIDANPSCRLAIPSDVCCLGGKDPQCPGAYNGAGDEDVMAIHPNIKERTDYVMRNMARLFSVFYANSSWGWGGGAYAGDCNQPDPLPTLPFYFMSEAVQAARYNSFSGSTTYSGCSRSNPCNISQQTSHYTCCSYCQYNSWGQCGYKYRSKAMVQLLFTSNAWNDVGSEGIWGGNTALTSSAAHCGMVFNPAYSHQGIGYYPGGSTTMVGIKDTHTWEDHVFPHATHFDWDQNDYTFLVQFFGGKRNVTANSVYLLYDGEATLMETVVGDGVSGFYTLTRSLATECEPYAFVAQDTDGNWWRLPEDESYTFATVDQPDLLVEDTATCAENHYFYTGTGWVANGGEGLGNAKTTENGCVGCDKVSVIAQLYEELQATDSPTIATAAPTTFTVAPTTATVAPTTAAPTTAAPTTAAPTTAAPTTATVTVTVTAAKTGSSTEDDVVDGDGSNSACSVDSIKVASVCVFGLVFYQLFV